MMVVKKEDYGVIEIGCTFSMDEDDDYRRNTRYAATYSGGKGYATNFRITVRTINLGFFAENLDDIWPVCKELTAEAVPRLLAAGQDGWISNQAV